MRIRKIAKQLKRWYGESSWDDANDKPLCGYKMSDHNSKTAYALRMTRRHYFGLRSKYQVGSMMWNLYTHKANSYYLYEEFLSFWCIDAY